LKTVLNQEMYFCNNARRAMARRVASRLPAQDFPFDSAADVGESCDRTGPGAPQQQGIA
jgi:hypothetical protein